MAQVTYEDPIHHLSGKISKKYRTCYNYRKRSDRKYTSVPGKRSTPATSSEIAHRTKFATCVANTRTRMMDPMQLPIDQAAYAAVKNQYPSFYAYVFNQEWALL